MFVLSLPGRLPFQGCTFPSANKKSPSSLPLEHSYVQSLGNTAVTALQTFKYRLFEGSLRLSSVEQEVGLLEHEPAVCSCSKKSQEHPQLYYKKHCQKVSGGDPRPLLSTGGTCLEHSIQVWAPQYKRDRDILERHHKGPPRVWSISRRKGS